MNCSNDTRLKYNIFGSVLNTKSFPKLLHVYLLVIDIHIFWVFGTNIICDVGSDGMWATWAQWGECTTTCGGGVRTRSRTCTNPAPAFGGDDCEDPGSESEACETGSCSEGKNGRVYHYNPEGNPIRVSMICNPRRGLPSPGCCKSSTPGWDSLVLSGV